MQSANGSSAASAVDLTKLPVNSRVGRFSRCWDVTQRIMHAFGMQAYSMRSCSPLLL